MEPFDLPKNIEEGGHSRRRISSILKAPRKSTIFHDAEQEENELERAKPAEKRNSRRVSFAPANDVLLFAKDVKNASPARSPLQELMAATAATTPNWVQVAVTDDRSQQILGIENLLNAPLHASQQGNVVNFDGGNDFGEKTVMFSTEDAIMDLTQSHTINIAGDADLLGDLSHQNILLTRGERRGTPEEKPTSHSANTSRSASDKNKDSEPLLELNFEDFLASLSKPSSSGSDRMAALTRTSSEDTKRKTQTVEKENQVPRSLSSHRGAFCPQDDVNTDLTEARTERTLGGGDEDDEEEDDDPFQCLFPTRDMYAHCDRKSSQAAEMKLKKRRKNSGSGDPKEKRSLVNLPVHAPAESHKETLVTEDDHREKTVRFSTDDAFMDITQSHTVNITADLKSQLRQNVNFSLAPGENTVPLAADEATMDITQCLTTNITSDLGSVRKQDEICDPLGGRSSVELCLNTGFDNLLTNPAVNLVIAQMTPAAARPSDGFTICPDDDVSMEITEAQTGRILEGDVSMDVTEVQTGRIGGDHLQALLRSQGAHHQSVDLKKVSTMDQDCGSSTYKETSMKSSLKTAMQRHQVKFDAEDDTREKTVRVTAADAIMDVTRSRTVNTIKDFQLHSFPILDLPANETKTVRFTANDADMEVTQSHTVKILADLNVVSDQNINLLPANGERTVRFTINDAVMDVTRSHTVNISTDLNQLSQPNVSLVPANGERTVRFTTNDADMDVTRSHTVNIATGLNVLAHENMDLFPINDEKTTRFTATDAGMDITRSHTVNISAGLNVATDPNVSQLPANGEKTVRFTTNDADMDVTGSHTVNIAADLNVPAHQNMDSRPANGEKTMRFTATDAGMDITRSHTVNISAGLNVVSDPNVSQLPAKTIVADLKMPSHQSMGLFPANGEKATRFAANDATMDATQSHTANAAGFEPKPNLNVGLFPASTEKTVRLTANKASMAARRRDTVNISAGFEPKSYEHVGFHPLSGDKTMRFTTNDASMEITHCFTVNIASDPASDLVLTDPNTQPTYENMNCPPAVKKADCGDYSPHSDLFSSAQVELGIKSSVSQKRGSLASFKAEATDSSLLQEAADSNCFQLKTLNPETSAENESPSFVSAVVEQPANETTTNCAEIGAGMDVTEPQTGCLKPASTDDSQHSFSSIQDYNSDHLEKTGLTSQNNEVLGLSTPDDVDSNKMETMTAHQSRTETFPWSQKMEPSDAGHDVDALSSQTNRRKSLADLQSKLRRLSNIIKAAPDAVAIESSTAPLPQLDPDLDKNPNDKTTSSPVGRAEEPSSAANATPFSLKTQQLMSRLSVGGFKPKLPQRNNPEESKKLTSAEEATRTFTDSVTRRLRDFNDEVDDVFDEELGSCEDMSETLDTRTPEKTTENENPSKEFYMFDHVEDDLFKEPFVSPFLGQKRPLPEGKDSKEDEKRLKASTEFDETAADSNVAAAHLTTQTIDSSSSHTGSRYEAASESTFKHSLFESQLEDYGSDGQKKLKDGTITVLEFFNLFNIDFVTHNPRQSVLPGRLSSDTDVTPLDLLKNRHINRPKLKVYEADIQTLTEKVEELKVRLQDLNKPLRAVNGSLWEEMRHFSEKELKSFRAKLKERNNFFRKTSKVQSHEMKEVLYSSLVRVNLEEQQKLRGTIQEADEMLKQLNDCIWGFEAEINAVTEKDSEDKKCLKTLQEEFRKITDVFADSDRQISELEMQKKQNSSKLNRMKAETKNLESHINMLNMLNEWRLKEEEDSWTSYTFLHETMVLQLVYEKPDGNAADEGSERKITNIAFRFDLNDEKSQFHARLVHKLVSEYIQEESAWVEKYPTSKHVPKLLHDVSLVVSPCRLLGEELRLLEMWGSLRFDVLHISCTGTQVHVVFSSLKKMSKFEVVFGVRLTNQLCVFQVQSFKNILGDTTMGQIEEIVASLTSETKLFTKIIKKIHDSLLC